MKNAIKAAHQCGVSLSDFWDMQPWHLRLIIQAEREKQEAESNRDIVLAWYMAAFSRTKKLQSLKEIFAKLNKKSTKSVEDAIIRKLKQYQAARDARNKN